MENVSIKLEKTLARQIEQDMKEFNYSTKTEFIRESLRDKIKALEEERKKKKAWAALFAARGTLKGKGKTKTEEEFYAWRKQYGEKLAKELSAKYGFND